MYSVHSDVAWMLTVSIVVLQFEIIKLVSLLMAIISIEDCLSHFRLLETTFVHWHCVTLMVMAKLRFVTIYLWIQLFSWACSEMLIKTHGLSNTTDLPYQLKWSRCGSCACFRLQSSKDMHKCSAHVHGVALVSGTTQECVKLGIYGIFTVLLPCFGELIASCNGHFSHFS